MGSGECPTYALVLGVGKKLGGGWSAVWTDAVVPSSVITHSDNLSVQGLLS